MLDSFVILFKPSIYPPLIADVAKDDFLKPSTTELPFVVVLPLLA